MSFHAKLTSGCGSSVAYDAFNFLEKNFTDTAKDPQRLMRPQRIQSIYIQTTGCQVAHTSTLVGVRAQSHMNIAYAPAYRACTLTAYKDSLTSGIVGHFVMSI